jgi:hypothetical protein
VRILLDEGTPDIIQTRLSSFAIVSVKQMGWRGIRNGALLDLMAADFEILITTDKNLPFQQNLTKREISVIILPANDIPSIVALLPRIEKAIKTISPGDFIQL